MKNSKNEPLVAFSSVVLIIIGIFLVGISFLVNNHYGEIPNHIVNDLNSGRDINEYNGTLLLLLDGGVFNVISREMTHLMIIFGGLFIYMGYFIHMNGKKAAALRIILSKEFWTTSSLYKFKPYKASSEALKSINEEKRMKNKILLKDKVFKIESEKKDDQFQKKKASLAKIKKST